MEVCNRHLEAQTIISGPGCSKLPTSLVTVSLKFQVLISISNMPNMPIFSVEKMSEAFAVQKLLSFFQQKFSIFIWL